jgi:hypothetical protein
VIRTSPGNVTKTWSSNGKQNTTRSTTYSSFSNCILFWLFIYVKCKIIFMNIYRKNKRIYNFEQTEWAATLHYTVPYVIHGSSHPFKFGSKRYKTRHVHTQGTINSSQRPAATARYEMAYWHNLTSSSSIAAIQNKHTFPNPNQEHERVILYTTPVMAEMTHLYSNLLQT